VIKKYDTLQYMQELMFW